jgi:hypothetical protein
LPADWRLLQRLAAPVEQRDKRPSSGLLNNITAKKSDMVRLYRPRAEVLDCKWKFPEAAARQLR